VTNGSSVSRLLLPPAHFLCVWPNEEVEVELEVENGTGNGSGNGSGSGGRWEMQLHFEECQRQAKDETKITPNKKYHELEDRKVYTLF